MAKIKINKSRDIPLSRVSNAYMNTKANLKFMDLAQSVERITAERDELKAKLTNRPAVKELAEVTAERDAYKASTVELLAACKRVGDHKMWRYLNGELVWIGDDGNEIETEHPIKILQLAIANAERSNQ